MNARTIVTLALVFVLCLGLVPAQAEDRAMEGNMYVEGYPIVEEPVSFRFLVCNDADPNTMQFWLDYAAKTNVDIQWDFFDYSTTVEKKEPHVYHRRLL